MILLKLTKTPLLLVLDEAQHLGEDKEVAEEHRDEVRILLKRIHTGGVGRPLILLAGAWDDIQGICLSGYFQKGVALSD